MFVDLRGGVKAGFRGASERAKRPIDVATLALPAYRSNVVLVTSERG